MFSMVAAAAGLDGLGFSRKELSLILSSSFLIIMFLEFGPSAVIRETIYTLYWYTFFYWVIGLDVFLDVFNVSWLSVTLRGTVFQSLAPSVYADALDAPYFLNVLTVL